MYRYRASDHDRREEYADDRIRGEGTVPLYGHDAEPDEDAENRHGDMRVDGKDQAERHAREGGMADGVGKEGHAEADDLHAHGRRHRREQDQGDECLLHEPGLQALEGEQGHEAVERLEIKHGGPLAGPRWGHGD